MVLPCRNMQPCRRRKRHRYLMLMLSLLMYSTCFAVAPARSVPHTSSASLVYKALPTPAYQLRSPSITTSFFQLPFMFQTSSMNRTVGSPQAERSHQGNILILQTPQFGTAIERVDHLGKQTLVLNDKSSGRRCGIWPPRLLPPAITLAMCLVVW